MQKYASTTVPARRPLRALANQQDHRVVRAPELEATGSKDVRYRNVRAAAARTWKWAISPSICWVKACFQNFIFLFKLMCMCIYLHMWML